MIPVSQSGSSSSTAWRTVPPLNSSHIELESHCSWLRCRERIVTTHSFESANKQRLLADNSGTCSLSPLTRETARMTPVYDAFVACSAHVDESHDVNQYVKCAYDRVHAPLDDEYNEMKSLLLEDDVHLIKPFDNANATHRVDLLLVHDLNGNNL